MPTRYMLSLECEQCGGKIKRSIQDILNDMEIGKHKTQCAHCNKRIDYTTGKLPADYS